MNRIVAHSLLVAASIACVAIALILARLPATKTPEAPRKPPIAEGPAMEIDPAEAAHAGEVRDDNGLGMKFRRCPPGAFRMGDPPAAARVTLRQGFWMGQFEVTQSEWRRVMGVTLREQRTKDPRQPRPVGDGT